MGTIIPDEGRDWLSETAVGDITGESLYIVAVGDGQSTVSPADSSLDNELYRANDDNENVTVRSTSTVGEIKGRIAVTGGLEVPAGSDIHEFGLFVDDGSTLFFRQVDQNGTTVQSGDRKTFEFTNTVVNE